MVRVGWINVTWLRVVSGKSDYREPDGAMKGRTGRSQLLQQALLGLGVTAEEVLKS